MTMKELANKIAKAEGLKSEVSIGNIREILAILSDMVWAEMLETYPNGELAIGNCLCKNGKRRAKRNKK